MLTIEKVSNILNKYTDYFSQAESVSLFQLKSSTSNVISEYFNKITGDIFSLKNLPSSAIKKEIFVDTASNLLYAYGVDLYPNAYFASILPDIIGKNDTLLHWIRSSYEKQNDLGLYTIRFVDALKVPLDVRLFVLKTFILIHAINNETNKGNKAIVKQLLNIRGD